MPCTFSFVSAEQHIADLQESKKVEVEKRLAASINQGISLYFWTVKHLILCQILYACVEDAQILCQNALQFFKDNSQMESDINFLKFVSDIYETLKRQDDTHVQLDYLLSSLTKHCNLDPSTSWKWKVCQGLPFLIKKKENRAYN